MSKQNKYDGHGRYKTGQKLNFEIIQGNAEATRHLVREVGFPHTTLVSLGFNETIEHLDEMSKLFAMLPVDVQEFFENSIVSFVEFHVMCAHEIEVERLADVAYLKEKFPFWSCTKTHEPLGVPGKPSKKAQHDPGLH